MVKSWKWIRNLFAVVVIMVIVGLCAVAGYLVANNGLNISAGPKYEIPGPGTRQEKETGMSDKQKKVISEGSYSLIYSKAGKTIESIYPINKVVTTSAFGITWKFASGFVTDISQPDKASYPTENTTYIKVNFFDQQGVGHGYWVQLNGVGAEKTFSIAVSTETLTDANALIASSSKPVPVSKILSEGLIRVGDQVVLQIAVEDTKKLGALRGMEQGAFYETLSRWSQAVEAGENFPVPGDGFFLPAEGITVPYKALK